MKGLYECIDNFNKFVKIYIIFGNDLNGIMIYNFRVVCSGVQIISMNVSTGVMLTEFGLSAILGFDHFVFSSFRVIGLFGFLIRLFRNYYSLYRNFCHFITKSLTRAKPPSMYFISNATD